MAKEGKKEGKWLWYSLVKMGYFAVKMILHFSFFLYMVRRGNDNDKTIMKLGRSTCP